ncbi:HlyD family type I secretion periplasmic adaptor subunit [Marinobacter bohaiensis]|uniref:HlyD family type I secretion periplasmic adaptor subunit n=1 Tax=Marinobacter bohaiensis TaxID=2201898 RepID=UPI000DAC6B3D|nr:HlyD family type I secretion periplasmic adaptor subunit [Marinobacter bohaiensis]
MSTSGYWQQLRRAYGARKVIWLIGALVISSIAWSAFAAIDEVVKGQGKLVPSASVQRVQSLDGGILRQLHVREGQTVEKGQLLVTLDETRARASYAEALARENALEARRNRLLLELEAVAGGGFESTPLTDASLEKLGGEAAGYRANLAQLQGRINSAREKIVQQRRGYSEALQKSQTLKRSLALLRDEIEITADAVDQGALSAAELRKLKRDRVSLEGQIEALDYEIGRLESTIAEAEQARGSLFQEFRARAQSDLSDTTAELARVREQLAGLNSQLQQTRLYAGMAGTVKAIDVTSIGGVIRPGETILDIVPEGDQLFVETRIAPRDIAHIHEGDDAIIKLSAYDFVIYGGIRGRVEHISPDALTNEDDESYYLAHVVGDSGDWGAASWQGKPLIPGMQAQVDILAGKKTILQYWLKPLLRAQAEAMREP